MVKLNELIKRLNVLPGETEVSVIKGDSFIYIEFPNFIAKSIEGKDFKKAVYNE